MRRALSGARRKALAVAAALLTLAALDACATRTVFVGPTFVTGDPARPEVTAVETDGRGTIVALHDAIPGGRRVRRVELPGALAVPGLRDAHIHLLGVGRSRERLSLHGASSPAEVRDRVAELARARPEASWIDGRGWDQSRFPGGEFPTWQDLEGATDRPVLLVRVDGHAAWANRAALDLAGLDAGTADPEGGRILRQPDGSPSGVLLDRAIALVRERLPPRTAADLERWAQVGAEACADVGLVAVHDMGMPIEALTALTDVDRRAPLPLRVVVYLDGDDEAAWQWLDAHRGEAREVSPRIRVLGIKLYADGALGSRGAALLADYADEAGHRGLLVTRPEELAAQVLRASSLEAQVAIHAIGDRGVRVALNALRAAPARLRPRVEHAQVVARADFARFVEQGAIASMQPTHATSDMRWAEARVGPERLRGAYAWRRMLDAQIPLPLGSDAPVESERPLLGLHAATTRTDADGGPPGGWQPDQRLTDAEALHGFAAAAAWAAFDEARRGTLTPGRQLDLTLLDGDPRGQAGAWLRTGVLGSVVDGRLRPASTNATRRR